MPGLGRAAARRSRGPARPGLFRPRALDKVNHEALPIATGRNLERRMSDPGWGYRSATRDPRASAGGARACADFYDNRRETFRPAGRIAAFLSGAHSRPPLRRSVHEARSTRGGLCA